MDEQFARFSSSRFFTWQAEVHDYILDKWMKELLILCLLAGPLMTLAQGAQGDLRTKVDSIIRYDIQYIPDSTTNVVPPRQWDTTVSRGLYPDFSSLPANPMTLIILDGKVVSLDSLNGYALKEVTQFNIYPKNDATARAIYGASARNGLVIINLEPTKE